MAPAPISRSMRNLPASSVPGPRVAASVMRRLGTLYLLAGAGAALVEDAVVVDEGDGVAVVLLIGAEHEHVADSEALLRVLHREVPVGLRGVRRRVLTPAPDAAI